MLVLLLYNLTKNKKQILSVMHSINESLKNKYVAEVLKNAAFEGWNDLSFTKAAKSLKLDQNYGYIMFPGGLVELINYFNRDVDLQLIQRLKLLDLQAMKVRERIFVAVMLRLEILTPNKAALRRLIGFYAMPQNLAKALCASWEVADVIWHGLNDNSTDFNYYTKRAILAGVYSASLLSWVNDTDISTTEIYVKKRINNALTIGNAKNIIKQKVKKIPFLRLIRLL
jgi:ubiquinone biosynthesis protein COQ9